MKKENIKPFFIIYLLVLGFIVIFAAETDAVSGPTDITIKKGCISMPDGGVTTPIGIPPACPSGTIQMWLPYDNVSAVYLPPGSFKITAVENETLTITVKNELGIPVSLVIPGQVMNPNSGPVWFSDINNPYGSTVAIGSRPTPADPTDPNDPAFKYRVRSFAHETPAGSPSNPGGPATYTWTNLREGTYLILSGTHPSLQVQMGIYGILVVQAAGGGPYDGIGAPSNDITLLFSEIDPSIHNAVNDVIKSFPSTNDYKPKYFLINGKPFPGNDPIPIGTAGETTLLRFLNAGLDTYVPLLQGLSMQIIAEDAFLKPANLRFNRYSIDLHAGKTFDALITNPQAGYIPIYDRRLYLSNSTQVPGGMLAYLEVTDGAQHTLTVATNGGTGTGRVTVDSLPGGINCDSSIVPPAIGATNCTQNYNTNTELKLVGHPNPGSVLLPSPNGWTGCDSVTNTNECIVTMNSAKNITANFKEFSTLRLLTPNGGERIQAGSAYLVQWGAPANAVTFRLRYSLDGGTTWLLIKNGITGNSYNWIVPTPGQNRKIAILQITAFNRAGKNLGSDVSDAPFNIITIRVTAPAAGDTLISGDIAPPSTISWVSGATPGLVKKIVIEYSKNNGVTWNRVKTLDNSTGLYDTGGSFSQWVIPAVASNRPDSFVRVTLKDAAGNVVATGRSGKFTIRVP